VQGTGRSRARLEKVSANPNAVVGNDNDPNATKAKARGALLSGLRSGELESVLRSSMQSNELPSIDLEAGSGDSYNSVNGADTAGGAELAGVAGTKSRTRGALLAGLRSGELEAAIQKLENGQAAEHESET
jgi:hypothetical protein